MEYLFKTILTQLCQIFEISPDDTNYVNQQHLLLTKIRRISQ